MANDQKTSSSVADEMTQDTHKRQTQTQLRPEEQFYASPSCGLFYTPVTGYKLKSTRCIPLPIKEPDVVVKRQEALAAARLKMQEELNAQVEKHKEKLRQLEEQKRRQKIEMWDSMQEGKSYKGNARKLPEEDNPGPSTSSTLPKRKSDRKPLRGGGYNPLSGEGGGACSWRPGRRGPTSGG
ncbi:selenoprotein S isoform X2 [Crocuta crocuta]